MTTMTIKNIVPTLSESDAKALAQMLVEAEDDLFEITENCKNLLFRLNTATSTFDIDILKLMRLIIRKEDTNMIDTVVQLINKSKMYKI